MTTTATHAAVGRNSRPAHALTGTGTLVRFFLRRDRIRLPAWIIGIVGFTILAVAALPDLYPDEASRQARAVLMQNPGTRAIGGPGYGLDDYTFGAMLSLEYLGWTAIFVALMSIFTVVRHVRNEEATGRAELVRSSRVGRHATTTAALVVAIGADVVLALLLAAGIGLLGLESVGWASSFLFSAALASVGVVFVAVAAVTSQVTEHARGASGIAGAVFALAYVLRAAGDMAELGGNVLSWLSPIGWAQQTRAYVDDRWWPLLLSVGATTVLAAAAYWLSTRRDVGASLVQTRPGRARATRGLAGPMGLAWRLQRTNLAGWSVAIFVFALGYGTLAAEVETFVEDMTVIQDAIAGLGGTVIESWLSVVTLIFAVVVTVFTALVTLRGRSEELGGRAEPVLATAVSRPRWLGSHLVLALGGSAFLQLLTGLGLGLTASQAVGDPDLLGSVVGAALVHVPAIWLVAGLTTALYGLSSRAAPLVWLVIAYGGLVGWLGVLLQFPQWARNLSPLGHTPLLPVEPMQWTPVLVLLATAALLVVAGLGAFRRRDLDTTA